MLRGQLILPDQIRLDVFRHRHRALPPVGEIAQHAPGIKHPVGRSDKGNAHPAAQPAAQKRRDTGMGVDNIGSFLFKNVFQNGPRLPHLLHIPAIQGGLIVSDAHSGDLRNIDAPVGYNYYVVSLTFQLLGQFNNVGLRAADVHAHGGH